VSTFTYDVAYHEERNRLTVAFRIILAIPHLIISQIWGELAQILALIQWFIIVFTGKRNEGIWNMQRSWLGYYARVFGYTDLLFDQYPAFASDAGPAPVQTAIAFDEQADRLTNGLRFIWIIPAAILAAVLGLASGVVVLISWFAIVITGRQPRGMWDFVLKVMRYTLQTQSYGLLMTDTYPKFDSGSVAAAAAPTPPAPFAPPPPPR
jgi:Domain of unknown function (DUF4389)